MEDFTAYGRRHAGGAKEPRQVTSGAGFGFHTPNELGWNSLHLTGPK